MGNLSRRQIEAKAEAAERRLARDASRRWPSTTEEQRRYVKANEHNQRINDVRWWTRGEGGSYVPLTDERMARLGTPAAAEDAVYLSEVVDALERMSGTEQAAWFLDAVEGTNTVNDRLKVHRIRKRLRVEMNHDDV